MLAIGITSPNIWLFRSASVRFVSEEAVRFATGSASSCRFFQFKSFSSTRTANLPRSGRHSVPGPFVVSGSSQFAKYTKYYKNFYHILNRANETMMF